MKQDSTLDELQEAYSKIKQSLEILQSIPGSDLDIEGTIEVSEKFAFRILNQKVGLEIYISDSEGYKDFTTAEIVDHDVSKAYYNITKG